jgi:nitrite reductase (NADH) large subunit
LSAARASGCATVEQLVLATGASTVCGSCKPLLASMVGGEAVRVALPGVTALLIAAVAALGLAMGIWLAAPLQSLDSVQGGFRVESLWHDSAAKRCTGFIVTGLALLGMLLSARKRIRRFRLGEVGHWRAVHAVLGVLTLVTLVAHTGFRLGHNLNLILMTNFLLLALLGGCAGAINALESRLSGPAAKRLRHVWTWGHIALAWPLPILISAHALVAYLF